MEDVQTDAEMAAYELKKSNLNFEQLVVDTEEEYKEALHSFKPDLILCDHSLPSFNSFDALTHLQSTKLHIPFILITAHMSEEVADNILKLGADDYILKDRLKRLPIAVQNAIEKYRYEKERKSIIDESYVRDTSARKTQQQLNNKLLLATKAAGVAIWEFDVKTGMFLVDDFIHQLYGIGPNDFDGTIEGWLKYIHPEDYAFVVEEFNNILYKTEEFNTEFRIVWPDGSIHFIRATALLEYDESGNVVRIVGTNQDITFRKEYEQVLKENEQKFRAFFEYSMDGILMLSKEGKILAANPAACAIFEMTEAELIEAGRAGILDASDVHAANIRAQREKEGTAKGEIIFKRKSGKTFPGEVSSANFIDAKGETLTSMIIRDVTDRKFAEQELISTSKALLAAVKDLEKIMDSSLDIICTIDGEGRFRDVSTASLEIWGYHPHEMEGKYYIDFVHVDDVAMTLHTGDNIMAGNPVTMFENRYIHKNGSIVPTLWSARWDEQEQRLFCVAKNATEKKRLEKAYENERKRLADIFLQAPSAIAVLHGPDHVYQLANPIYLELVGKRKIIGKKVKEVIPEVESQGFINLLNKVYETGESFSAKETLIKLDRKNTGALEDVYLDFVYQPNRDAEGNIEGIFVFAIDVTEQVEARKKLEEKEENLRISNERFEIVSKVTNDAIWDWNLLDDSIYWSDSYYRILADRNPGSTTTGAESIMVIHPDDKDRVVKGIYSAIDNKQAHWQDEYRIIKKNGEVAFVFDRGSVVYDEHNKAVRFVGALQDITERKISEEKLHEYQHQLLASQRVAHVGSWQLRLQDSKEPRYIECSEETLRIIGEESSDKILPIATFCEHIHPEDKEAFKAAYKEAVAKQSQFSLDHRIIDKDGNIIWVHHEAQVLKETSKNYSVKIIGSIKDITVRKQHELQIKQSVQERELLIQELTRSNKDLKQFTYITSHNFRAPLSNLIGLLSLVDYDALDENNRQIIEMFKLSTQQLNNTINDLIQILIIKNNVNVSTTHTNMKLLVEDVCAAMQHVILEATCTVEKNIEAEVVLFNKSYMESILINLLSNAIKYRSAARLLRIKIETKHLPDGDVQLRFSDNGLGIDVKRHRNNLFGLYQRFHNNSDSVGLGLFIVKSQVNALGGTIDVESEVDKGTTFIITIKGDRPVTND
nr:PAS domain S-box protein [Aridibaculum aurantiacum]